MSLGSNSGQNLSAVDGSFSGALTTCMRVLEIPVLLAGSVALVSFPSAALGDGSIGFDSKGVNGFAMCGTYDPTSSYYVPGDPVYLSDTFEVKTDSPNYELAFKSFLKKKYGWSKNVTCSVAYTSDGAAKTFKEKINQAGTKLVRTGWTLASGSAGTAVASEGEGLSVPAAASDPALGNEYWVCRVSGADRKDYNSDIFRGSPAGGSKFPETFGQFVQTKYKVKFLSQPTCTDYGVLGQQQAQEALKGFASYSTGVMTGWKYTTGSAAPPHQATAAPANNGAHWICQVNYYQKNYVSAAFLLSAEGSQGGGAMSRLNRDFRSFLESKYGLKPHVGSGSCLPQASGAQAESNVERWTSSQGGVATGWKPGMQDGGAPVAVATSSEQATPASYAPAAVAEAAPAHSAAGPLVTANITVRLVDAVNSSIDPAGKRYRAVVTKSATAGSVQIPENTLGSITLAQQSAGTFSAQLVALKLNGQDVQVSSTTVTATSMAQQAQQAAKKIGGFLSSFGKQSATANQATSAISTAGNHVAIPPGTSLTFSTSVPQPGVPVASAPAAPAQSVMAAGASSGGNEQENGERGPDGQIMGGTTSGVMTAYSCTAEAIPPGKHRQTTYVTAPFNSVQPQRWITFWYSQYIHKTYSIPSNVSNYTVDCNTFGNKTPAQQQAAVNAQVTRLKERNDDVVQLKWVPTQTPEPGVSVSQLNDRTGQIVTGGIGSNLPSNTNPAGSVALCGMNASDGKEYISSIFPAGNHHHSDFDVAFANHLSTKYLNGKVLGNGGCEIVTPAHAQAMLQQWKKDFANHKIAYVDTGWSYGGPEAGPVQSAQSNPPGYILCTTNAGNGKAYTSAIFKGTAESLPIEQAFLAYLATHYGQNVPHNTSCMKNRYIEDPQRYLYSMKNQAPGGGIKIIETGWTYNGAEPVTSANVGSGDANPEASAGGQYVICYSDANQSPLYLSGNFHIDVPPPPGAQSSHSDNGRSAKALGDLKSEFLRFLQKQYGYHSSSSYPGYCNGYPQPDQREASRQVIHERFSHLKIIDTGWTPGTKPPPVAGAVPAAPANPFASIGGVYTGTYTCAKGPVDMKLKLSLNESSILNGTMTFYLPPGSHTKAYTFSLGGPLQKDGSFNLRPMKWEGAEPPNYLMVGLNGTVNPQTGRLSGKVDYSGCGNFEAMKGRED